MKPIEDTMPAEMQEVIQKLRRFAKDRDWDQFHTPGNLAKSIVIEASELMADFQWEDPTHYTGYKERAEDEIADIFIYMLMFCDKLGIDPIVAANAKIKLNAKRYPVAKCKGSCAKAGRDF